MPVYVFGFLLFGVCIVIFKTLLESVRRFFPTLVCWATLGLNPLPPLVDAALTAEPGGGLITLFTFYISIVFSALSSVSLSSRVCVVAYAFSSHH